MRMPSWIKATARYLKPQRPTTVRRHHARPPLRVEMLESRMLLHANAVMDAEHLAVFGSRDPVTQVVTGGLVPDSAVTDRSIASGNWSDPSIWSNGVPKDGDNVVISAGTVVTIDGNASVDSNGNRVALRTIRDDGVLRFDPHANTTLLVDTLLVGGSGLFEMGTEAAPIDVDHKARVIFADREKFLSGAAIVAFEEARRAWDPLQFTLGLVSHGAVSVHGAQVTSFIAPTKNLSPGSFTYDLGIAVPANWKVGDRLLITGNTPTDAAGNNQDEQVKIAGISGSMLTLDPSTPLKYMHFINSNYIANVSRNVTFESESPSLVARRGHVMFMHNDNVHVDAAGFYGLGRTDKRTKIDDPVVKPDPDNPGQMTTDVLLKDPNPQITNDPQHAHRVMAKGIDPITLQVVPQYARTGLNPRGRYAVHFHRTGTEPGDDAATINDSAVVDSPGWGIVNHSSNVDITDNVVFNAVGAAYVTEAGDEIGTFVHNIAIHSLGSGEQIESRKLFQDFGHDGSGFWLQGGNVSLINNVVSGQRHAGYIFFPRGLDQKGLGITEIEGENLSQYAWAKPGEHYNVEDVPLKEFRGNVTFAVATGFESWFSLLNVTHQDRSVLENFRVSLTTDHGIFTPYTNQMTFKKVTVLAAQPIPTNTGFDRNEITRNLIYDHVKVQGWAIGINAPTNGVNTIVGGTFNNLKNIYITTANSRDRVVNINDASPTDPIVFLDNLQPIINGVPTKLPQYDVYLLSNFNPLFNDVTRIFDRDAVLIGLVSHNGQQVYYNEQAADFTPFPSTDQPNKTKFGPKAAAFVPSGLLDKTNAQLMADYGLSVGGIPAPASATKDPLINGLVGPATTYLPDLYLFSPKYFNTAKAPYQLIYGYWNTAQSQWKYIVENTPTPLVAGWNLVSRTLNGQTRTMMVFNDNIPPVLELSATTLTVLNQADLDNGTLFMVDGFVVDNSVGKLHFSMTLALNDSKFVSPVKTYADGTKHVIITFSIQDFAGNVTIVNMDLLVTLTADLIKDVARLYLPRMTVSLTLFDLLGHG